MKQYLKMADVFVGEYKPKRRIDAWPPSRYGETLIELSGSPAQYAVHAINSHDELVHMNQELLAALEGLLGIVGDSDGVSGYHLNSDIAEWGEFEELNAAYDAVNKANGGAAK